MVDYASPLKIFDYMAAGRAIVAPDQENIREILRDGETALLFDPSRPEAMWQAIARLARDAGPAPAGWEPRPAPRLPGGTSPGPAMRGAWPRPGFVAAAP